jgi:hypothetical protein
LAQEAEKRCRYCSRLIKPSGWILERPPRERRSFCLRLADNVAVANARAAVTST